MLKSNLFENEKSAATATPQNLMGAASRLFATGSAAPSSYAVLPGDDDQTYWWDDRIYSKIGPNSKARIPMMIFSTTQKPFCVLVYNNQTNQTSFSSTKERLRLNWIQNPAVGYISSQQSCCMHAASSELLASLQQRRNGLLFSFFSFSNLIGSLFRDEILEP